MSTNWRRSLLAIDLRPCSRSLGISVRPSMQTLWLIVLYENGVGNLKMGENDESGQGRKSSEDLLQLIDQIIRERQGLTISNYLPNDFHCLRRLQTHLEGQRFTTWLCRNHNYDYVEKELGLYLIPGNRNILLFTPVFIFAPSEV